MTPAALILLAALGAASGAPSDQQKESRVSSSLPAEHRQGLPPIRVFETLDATVDAVVNSKTVSAIDEAAAQVALLFGDVVEDVGDFVVDTVQDLPMTIERVSQRVGDAVQDGNERVVIVVKGVKRRAQDTHNATVATVDKVVDAFNTSQVASSFHKLGESIVTSFTRIVGSIFNNMEKIDSAVADSIRRVSVSAMPNKDGTDADKKPESVTEDSVLRENEIRTLN
ncbi:uncharacterized protein LOC122263208 [Penaeus japonicus]|uniref:uncharacterized protein LOC122263208 n=1 Tax=Penaeus japonicus TaxID=27405 RepID=UPI001C714DD1|nr:uncharacterized protein LOC122263208 [Penaeus japonicus]XP_042887506.1 uncharacterized protein LOC122263208 [Penaeus japonicus]